MFAPGYQSRSEVEKSSFARQQKYKLSFGADKTTAPKATLEEKAKSAEALVNKLDEAIGDKIQNKQVKKAFSIFHSIVIPIVTFATTLTLVGQGGERCNKYIMNFVKYLAKKPQNSKTFLGRFKGKISNITSPLIKSAKTIKNEDGSVKNISKIERYFLNPLINTAAFIFAGLLGLQVAFNKDQREKVEGFVKEIAGDNDSYTEDSSND